MTQNAKYRLVTRSDFDGLVCAVLLKEMGILDEILFVHPKDMQDGKIEITDRDITTNLPYVPDCHLAFDHHSSEMKRVAHIAENHIIDPNAPSAARVVYEYYGADQRFPSAWREMMLAVDQADSAQYNASEVLDPSGWVLLNFLMDARTGLGRFREFRISNYQLMMKLIDYCGEHTVEEILALPDVAERVDLYRSHREKAAEQITRCATVHDNLVVLDLRDEETIWVTNRFAIYALHPQCNISMHVMWGLRQQNTVLAIGNSIINRTSKTDIGALCLGYGGGGHHNAGTCQVANDAVDETRAELIEAINKQHEEAGEAESALTTA